jgi:acetolactate synthase I/II/III large subunit
MTSNDRRPVSISDALVQALLREGVDTAFGVASGYLSGFLDSMRRGGIRAITSLHEGAAACAAAGYAMASGKLAVVYGQAGPGVTNTLTGVAGAYMDSIPMLLLAAQSPTYLYARDAHQEATGATHGIDQFDIFRTTTAARFRPPTPETVMTSARRAIAIAQSRRLPTLLEVAADLFTGRAIHDDLAPAQYRPSMAAVDAAGVEELASLLRDAKRPVLLVGHRAIHRSMSADIVELCEQQDLPCATVDFAKGSIPEDHPLAVGILGSCGHLSASDLFAEADLVIALGVRFSTQTTFSYDHSLFHNLVQIDDHPDDIGRNFPVRLGIAGDLPATVKALVAALRGTKRDRGSAARVLGLREHSNVYTSPLTGRAATTTPMALTALRQVLPRNTFVTGDSGLTLQYVKHFFPVYSEDGFHSLYSLAPMGSGLPLAIGVQLARPDAVVLCPIGDGGALVHLSELAVAAHYNLPIITVIFNNRGYKQVSDRMERYQGSSYACDLPAVDFVAAARAYGCDAYRAETDIELAGCARTALEKRRPTVIEMIARGDNLFDVTPLRIRASWDRIFESPDQGEPWPFPR